MKKNFKGIRKKEQGNKFVTEDIKRHTEDDSPKYLQTQNHVITRTNRAECGAVCQNDRLSAGHIWQTRSHVYGEVKCQAEVQSDVVIPNKLSNGDTCKGLLRRFVHKITNNNEISPHNDMDNKTVKNLFPYCPISFSLKKKFAFTLAEVLITLGIIGIVAAMTIPTLITAHQKKQTVVKLQRAISVLNQAYKLSFDDVGEPSAQEAYDMGGEAYFKKYWAPYVKVLNYCPTARACGYSKTYFDTLNYTNKPWIVVTEFGAGTSFLTADGFFYTIRTSGGDMTYPAREIFVDINGDKAPNMIGKDVFVLQRKEDGEKGGVVVPYGSELNARSIEQLCSSDGTNLSNGYACAEKIKRAGWVIDKSYPWK